LKEKNFKRIILHLVAGILIAVPWLIRNVIISGYLIYPYSKLDIFNVDWKMLPSILDYDKMEITVWGRKLQDVKLYHQNISEWIGGWYNGQNLLEQILIVTGGISVIIVIGILISKTYERAYSECLLYLVAITGVGTWFLTAPLLRYGSAYLMLPICIVLKKIYNKKEKIIYSGCLTIMILVMCVYFSGIGHFSSVPKIKQENYSSFATDEVLLDGIKVYIPQEGDQVGYNAFPSTPYENVLNIIELRSEEIQTGFKVKDQYKGMIINTYGDEWER